MQTYLKAAAGVAATLALSGAAQAGCGGDAYCKSDMSKLAGGPTLAPLSTYFEHGHDASAKDIIVKPSAYGAPIRTGSDFVVAPRASRAPIRTGSDFGAYSTPRHALPDTVVHPSGSISETYSASSYEVKSFTGTLPGLGHNESLAPTACPVSVHNPEGGKVVGCYNVVKPYVAPAPRVTYYRVVRPIIYVRYPVPTPVAVPTCCAPQPVAPVCGSRCAPIYPYRSRYGY